MPRVVVALLLIVASCEGRVTAGHGVSNKQGAENGTSGKTISGPLAPELSPTRQLRRVHLVLRGKEPTLEQYEALLASAPRAMAPSGRSGLASCS